MHDKGAVPIVWSQMGVVWFQACVSTGFTVVLEGFGWSLDSDLEAPFAAFFVLVACVVRIRLVGCFPTPPLAVAAQVTNINCFESFNC